MNLFKAYKYQPVEIVVPASFTGSVITLQNQQSLYNVYVQAIEVYPNSVMPFSPITGGITMADVDANKSNFEFFQGTNQFANRIPFVRLNPYQMSNGTGAFPFGRDLFLCDNWLISWDKCKMNLTAPLTATGVVVTLGIYYTDMPTSVKRGI